ncbi:MAG: ATP-grasp domain-containing protein [Archaeoglobaceae archaeon]
MKIFLYEHATCGGELPDSIAVEGLAMFLAALRGFRKQEVLAFVRERFAHLGFPVAGLESFESFAERSDAFLVIAPENDLTLLKLTRIAEKHSLNLGSSSRALRITCDKWELYKRLKGKVNVPKTSKKPLDVKYVVKPRCSCGGENIRLGGEVCEGFVAQEFVEGLPLSVSLMVGEDVTPLSVNLQLLRGFEYEGAVVPAEIDEIARTEVVEEAITAAEAIKGLNGYVGVDVVYADQPYVIEVNARVTTPAVLFDFCYGANVGELILRNVCGGVEPLTPIARFTLKKDCSGMIIARLNSCCLSAEKSP